MRRTILSHFSQRYPKIPVIKSFAASTCIAFDLMVVNLQGGRPHIGFKLQPHVQCVPLLCELQQQLY